VFKYLESRDVDEVGYTLRTASLMTDPEYFFDDRDPSDYRLFGIRYLILPARGQPAVRARLTMRSGPYWLWTVAGNGYVQAGRITGEISADRTDLGARSRPVLASNLAAQGAYLSVTYGASYDPGWTATVNGRRVPAQMVAPALVAVNVPAGTDRVVFRFHGYGDYPELLTLSALTLAILAAALMVLRRRRRCCPDGVKVDDLVRRDGQP
jgi:Bacterial membrane protein YfhO